MRPLPAKAASWLSAKTCVESIQLMVIGAWVTTFIILIVVATLAFQCDDASSMPKIKNFKNQ